MIDSKQIGQIIGETVYGSDGDKLGKVGQIYLDDATGRPEWATVQTGLFGNNESFVPVAQAEFNDSGLTVPYSKVPFDVEPLARPRGGPAADPRPDGDRGGSRGSGRGGDDPRPGPGVPLARGA